MTSMEGRKRQVRSYTEKRARNCVRVINVSISTVKARKILRQLKLSYAGEARDAYLQGIRDVIGGDLGLLFARAVESGDIRKVARFCNNGWRILGGRDLFTARMDIRTFLREMRGLCEKALREGGAE